MKRFYLEKVATDVVSKAILITGTNRSGTTMMGTLVHSLDDVEYAYAPPFLYSHIPLIDELPRDLWCLQYETYLFEDCHLELVAGRRLNFNEHDSSYIYRAKTKSEIEPRLARTEGKVRTLPVAASRRIAYKLTDMLPFVAKLRERYPAMTTIVMFRSPETTVSSLMRKGWFSDEGLSRDDAIWPSKVAEKPFVPIWVPDDQVDDWRSMEELDRYYFYYTLMYENVRANDGLLLVDYDSFVQNPREQFANLAAKIDCKYGEKTKELLENVRDPGTEPLTTLEDIGPELRRRVEDIVRECRGKMF